MKRVGRRPYPPFLALSIVTSAAWLSAVVLCGEPASPEVAPIMDFDFSQAHDAAVVDRSGNKLEMKLGRTTKIVAGPEGMALAFDGTPDAAVRFTAESEKRLTSLSDGREFSVSFWLKADKLSDLLNLPGCDLRLDENRRLVAAGNTAGHPVQAGRWCHVAIIHSASRRHFAYYLDGDLQAEHTNPPLPAPWPTGALGETFTGAVGSLRVYGRELTAAELLRVKPSAAGLEAAAAALAAAAGGQNADLRKRAGLLQRELDQVRGASYVSVSRLTDLQRNAANLGRIAADLSAAGPAAACAAAPLVCYAAPAISPEIRLPYALPPDGKLADELPVVAARGQFVAATFVVFPLADVGKLELAVADLAGQSGALPASCVDARLVKCWIQSGNAWYGYHANRSRRVMVPELLLRDDVLVKVDESAKRDFLRIDYPTGSRYCDITAREKFDRDIGYFNYTLEPVHDSPVLLPVAVGAGRCQQFWLTVHPPQDARPGIYQGRIGLIADGRRAGELKLTLRVLPFELPAPRTHYDLDREFYTMLFWGPDLNLIKCRDAALDDARSLAEYRNMRAHNVLHPLGPRLDSREHFLRQIALMKQAGLPCRPIFGADIAYDREIYQEAVANQGKLAPEHLAAALAAFRRRIDLVMSAIEQAAGHREVYFEGVDESAQYVSLVTAQGPFREYVHSRGGKIFTTGWDNNLKFSAYSEDIHVQAEVIDPAKAARWHAVGGRLASYASPFAGPENPEIWRRNYGLLNYKNDGDGSCHFWLSPYRPWNEFFEGGVEPYRSFSLVYPTLEGVIDTIAWEGLREGIDDVRYATLLRQLAARAMKSADLPTVYAGRKAVQFFELVDPRDADLDTVRLEMIDRILGLLKILGE